jgi:hypothetical protein
VAEVVRQKGALQIAEQMVEDRGVVMHEMEYSLENLVAMNRVFAGQVEALQAQVRGGALAQVPRWGGRAAAGVPGQVPADAPQPQRLSGGAARALGLPTPKPCLPAPLPPLPAQVRALEPAAKEAERLALELAEREAELRQAKQLKVELMDQKAEIEGVALRWQTEVARLQVGRGSRGAGVCAGGRRDWL